MNFYFVFLMFTLVGNFCFSSEKKEISYGTAFSDDGKVVYKEKHTSQFSDGKLRHLTTEYYLNEGNIFGSIRSSFLKSSTVPSYTFEDKRYGRSDGVKWVGNEVNAFAKPNDQSVKKEKTFLPESNTIAGQGLHNYIMVNLDKFIKDKENQDQIAFLIPMNQGVYSFRIRTNEVDRKKGIVKIRIEPDNWFFRLVAPHIDVTYEMESHRLLEYKGPSNLLDDNKNQMNVTIAYKYP